MTIQPPPRSGVYPVARRVQRLGIGELLYFRDPLTWRQILKLQPAHTPEWWRDAVVDADELGRGWLVWNKKERTWRLTALGYAHLGLKERSA